jgi:hypothetical protein
MKQNWKGDKLIAIAKANKLLVECVNLLTPARGNSVAVNN